MSDENPTRYRVSKKDRKTGDIPKTQAERRIGKLDRLILAAAVDKDGAESYLEVLKRIKKT